MGKRIKISEAKLDRHFKDLAKQEDQLWKKKVRTWEKLKREAKRKKNE